MIKELLRGARNQRASDVHISVGAPVMIRIDGVLREYGDQVMTMEDTVQCAEELGIANLQKECDFAFSDAGMRYRVNAYLRDDTVSLAVRIIPDVIPSVESLHLPNIIAKFADLKEGLVIITGPTGSGKTTTLAALVDRINALRQVHVITLEDPVEYKHQHRRALINQRDVGRDTDSYKTGLRAALREDPDVILVGEMRDAETMEIALTAAETGHLVFCTMHTGDVVGAVNRIIDSFGDRGALAKSQLANCLQGIVAQQLLLKRNGGRVAACEILVATPALRNLIREGKVYQIPNFIQTGAQFGMQNMEVAKLKLRRDGLIN